MSFTRASNVGTYESPSQTIGALIERSWDTDNIIISTNGVANVKFIYDQTIRDPQNITAMQEAIVFRDMDTFPVPERTSSDGSMVGLGESITIDIFAGNQLLRRHYENEVHSILRNNRPIGNNPPMKKSNNTDNSSIHDYDENMVVFIAYDDGLNGREMSAKSSAVLTVLSELEFA